MKQYILFSAALFACISFYGSKLTAQQLQLHTNYTRLIGGLGYEQINDLLYDVRDNSLVFTGWAMDSCGTGDLPPCPPVTGRRDLVVGKKDSSRNLVWLRQYGGSQDDGGTRIITTEDGGYAVIGSTSSTDGDITSTYGDDVWLVKLDSSGNLQWQKCYGSVLGAEMGTDLKQTKDGGFILVGTSSGSGEDVPFQYVQSPFTTDWLVIKTDAVGDISWTKTLGGTGYEEVAFIFETDNSYYLAGFSTSKNYYCDDTSWHPGVPSEGDYLLVKLDSAGNYLWNRSYGGSLNDRLEDAIFDEQDTTIVMVGRTISTDYMVPPYPSTASSASILAIKARPDGTLVWSKVYGDNSSESLSYIRKSSIHKGYIISCQAALNTPIPPYYFGGSGDIRIFLTDSAGNQLADKIVGGVKGDMSGVAIATNVGFAVGGATNSDVFAEGTTSPKHGTNSEAYISYLYDTPAVNPVLEVDRSTGDLLVYPNPAGDEITVELRSENTNGVLKVTDAAGREIWRKRVKNRDQSLSIDVSDWQRGVFILHWQDENATITTQKLVLQ